MKIKIGTRGSNLALTQTNWVADQLKNKHRDLDVDIVIIKTKGDKILDKPLDKIGDKGLFVKEIESALLAGDIDCAVHSLKDMPSEEVEGLSFSKTPLRADRRDVLVLKKGYHSLDDIPVGSTLGTGSKRRMFQINAIRPDLKFEPVRGNIETRMGKIESQGLAGVVLAAAGIHRVNLKERITCYLDEEDFTPAPAQGALGVQYRSSNQQIEALLNTIGDEQAILEISGERSFMKHIQGGCHAPVGAFAVIENNHMILKGLFGTDDGKYLAKAQVEGHVTDGENLGKELAERLLEDIKQYEG